MHAPPAPLPTGIEFATVDRWWELARLRPAYREFTQTPLKDYGYLRILEDLERIGAQRILEFGCGLWAPPGKTLLELSRGRELWAVDDWQNLHYFPPEAEWLNAFDKLRCRFPWTRLVRGLIGQQPLLETLPKGYFDAIVSVSVLEEIPDFYGPVISHAYELLRPGGYLLGTTDYCATPTPSYPWPSSLQACVGAQRNAGFELSGECRPPERIDDLLLENPVGVMIYYESGLSDDRKYWGHFATMYTAARRPC